MRLKNHSHFIMLGLLEQKRRGKRKKNNREKSEYSYESESESDTGSESDIEPAPPGMTLTFIRIHKRITRHTDNQFTFHLACTWSQSCSHTTRPARSPVRIQLGMLTIVFTYHLAFFSFFFSFPLWSCCFSPWRCLLQSNLIWSDWCHFVVVEDLSAGLLNLLRVFFLF